jgi:hypothetical protein
VRGSALSVSSSGKTRNTPHSAIVITAETSANALLLTVYPVPAYSNAAQETPHSTSEDWLASQHEDFRKLHIPLSPATSRTKPAEFTHIPNPTQSGPNGREPYVDRLPCWIKVERISLRIPYSQPWKSFSHDIKFPQEDIIALDQYEVSLAMTTLTVNLFKGPELLVEVCELYPSLSQSYPGLQFGRHACIYPLMSVLMVTKTIVTKMESQSIIGALEPIARRASVGGGSTGGFGKG